MRSARRSRSRGTTLLAGIILILAAASGSAFLAHPLATASSALWRAVTGAPRFATADADTQLAQTPTINGVTISKEASVPSFSAAGLSITYIFQITNFGTSQINAMEAFDHIPPDGPGVPLDACDGNGSLAAGLTRHCTLTYTTTQDDVGRGEITDRFTLVFHRPGSGDTWMASVEHTVPFRQGPAVGILKVATPDTFTAAGQTITYTYTVTNSGSETLSDITVTDGKLGPISCPETMLASGDLMTCTASYTTVAADVTAGRITNSVTVVGRPPSGPVVTDSDTLTIGFARPGIGITKTAVPASYGAAGEDITYTFLVSSTGDTALHSVTVTDNKLGPVQCPPDIAAGQTVTCIAHHTTTDADLAGGNIINVVSATGLTTPGIVPVNAQATSIVTLNNRPAIEVDKTAFPGTYAAAGEPIQYTYLVTNTGDVPLTGVTLTDDTIPGTVCGPFDLPLGAQHECRATHITTDADVTLGHITNTATAAGTTPSGGTVTGSAEITVVLENSPSLAIQKTADAESFAAAGQEIVYTYTVVNNGDVPVSGITVHDGELPSGVACTIAFIPAGADAICTVPRITTANDVANGEVENTAFAAGTSPAGVRVESPPVMLFIPLAEHPQLGLVKDADAVSFAAAGQQVRYTYTVSNTGDTAVNNITVHDTKFPGGVCTIATIPSGQDASCAATYLTTGADVTAGAVRNTAFAAGATPGGVPVESGSRSLLIPLEERAALGITKTASVGSFNQAGTVITYTYTVANTGNVTLEKVTVTDSRGLAVSCPLGTLVPGQDMRCAATYTTTAADVDAGQVNDTATAAGLTPSGAELSAETGLSVPSVHAPELSIEKTASTLDFSRPGIPVSYFYVVTNAGNVTLDPVTVSDSRLGPITCPQTALAPGQRMICTATHVTTAADVGSGSLRNVATVTGRTPAGIILTATSTAVLPVSPIPAPVSPITPVRPPVTG